MLYAHDAQEVATALQYATLNNVPITVAAGRHKFLGNAVINSDFSGKDRADDAVWRHYTVFATGDVSNLTNSIVSPDNSTIRIGAGMKNALMVHNLKKNGIPGAAGIVGNCPSVGTSGGLTVQSIMSMCAQTCTQGIYLLMALAA